MGEYVSHRPCRGSGVEPPVPRVLSIFGKVFLRKLQLFHYTGRITQLARRVLRKFIKILINIHGQIEFLAIFGKVFAKNIITYVLLLMSFLGGSRQIRFGGSLANGCSAGSWWLDKSPVSATLYNLKFSPLSTAIIRSSSLIVKTIFIQKLFLLVKQKP